MRFKLFYLQRVEWFTFGQPTLGFQKVFKISSKMSTVIFKIAWTCLLIGLIIAQVHSNQLEAKKSNGKSEGFSALTIKTNSSETFLVYIVNWQNNTTVTTHSVVVSETSSYQIWHNPTYPYYYFDVWSLPVYTPHCNDTLGRSFQFKENVNYTLFIYSSDISTNEIKCSLTEAAEKANNPTAWIIIVVLFGICGCLLVVLLCIHFCCKPKSSQASNVESAMARQGAQTQTRSGRGSSAETERGRDRYFILIEPFQQNRSIPSVWRVQYRPQNQTVSIQRPPRNGSTFNGRLSSNPNSSGVARIQFTDRTSRREPLGNRYAASTLTFNYVKYVKESCSICLSELEENELVM